MSFPRYPEYKHSGVEWLGEVPCHWEVKRLRFVVEINPSKSEVAKLTPDTEVSFLPMEAIGDDGSLNLERTRPIQEVGSGYTYFREDDVAVAKITPCFENGKGAVMRGLVEGLGFGTTELIVTRPRRDHITSEYLHCLYTSATFRRLGEASMYGAGGQKRVPDDFIRDFEIGLPAVPEQQAIVTFLNRETSKIDALVAEQEKLIELLKEKRQAIISHAVTRGLDPAVPMKDSGIEWLGKVPVHWEVAPLKRFVVLTTSGPRGWSDLVSETGAVFFQSQNIGYSMEVSLGESNRITPPSDADAERTRLKSDDVVICITGGRTGAVAHVPQNIEEAYVNQHVCLLRPSAQTLGKFLAYCLFSIPCQEQLSRAMYGLKQGMGLDQVRSTVVACPSMEEQREIIAFLDAKVAAFDALIAEARRAIGLLTERRAALISAAVTGRIDVRGLVTAEAAEAA